ncbi:MAG: triacylglycerol lipase [Oscillospiraceae bacterium]|nr:triacylglycerol lipase [Oscillospiraceae bacterium]
MALSTIYHIFLATQTIPDDHMTLVWSLVLCAGVLFVVFWVGILCVYLTSAQLGFRLRLIGLLCGLIPIANLVALFFILKTTSAECMFEIGKDQYNKQRKCQQVCATKYPILMVHGVFFRDTKFFNYWGRIPKELEINGATIFYGNHPSAASVAESAAALKERILQILDETGAEKVNIIAHSKGGLDCRYAIAQFNIADCVASLTTVNTPHRGCLFADYLLTKIPSDTKDRVAKTYNTALRKLGEKDADFLAAVNDLTDAYCQQLDNQMPTPEGVFCQSIGSVLRKAGNGKFPLNFSYHLVKYFSGENDGLVSEDSFAWGETYTLLRSTGKRGISHGDMIDLNRENIPGFDVREFYVGLVKDLKNRGL